MVQYISFIRGLNVSGHNKIKMNDLIDLYKRLGYVNVQSYIQSGNVIYYSLSSFEKMNTDIVKAIKIDFDFAVEVFIYSKAELQFILDNNPYVNNDEFNVSNMHVTLLSGNPEKSDVLKIQNIDFNGDRYSILNNTIYLYCPNGYGKTKLSNTFFEKKFKLAATTRNWNTLNKLVELCD